MHIQYSISHAPKILHQIQTQLHHRLEGSYLMVQSDAVHGTLYGAALHDQLSVYGVSIDITQNLTVSRSGTLDPDLIILDFHIDSFAKLFIDGKETKELMVGSYLASSDYVSSATNMPHTKAKFISFIFHKDWLLKHIQIPEERLIEFIQRGDRYFFFRAIDYQLSSEVNEVYRTIYKNESSNPAFLRGCALKILSLYFGSFELYDESTSINQEDMKAIERACQYIDSHLEQKIEIKDLLDIVAMSETKFRNLFKSILGSSPVDYIINRKLWYAKSLIESGEQISTVVLQIGYTNHSYFTRSFKAFFGLTPRRYQEETMRQKEQKFN